MAQYGRPSSDVSTGNWTTAPLWGKVDETPYSDTDYIQLNNSTSSSCEMGLSSVTDPVGNTGHVVRIRCKKAGSGSISVTGYLYEGANLRATIAITLTTAYATTTYNLSAAEADSITNYGNLSVRLTGVAAASSRYVYCSWIEFEVPDYVPPATQLVIQDVVQAQTSDTPGFTQHNTLVIQDVSQGQGSDIVALVQHNTLAIQDVSQIQSVDSPTLTYHEPSTNLIIQDVTQTQSVETPGLTQHNVLSIADATQGQSVENVTLTPHAPGGITLVIADVTQAQSAENISLVQHSVLSIQDVTQMQSAENVVFETGVPALLILERGFAIGLFTAIPKGMEIP